MTLSTAIDVRRWLLYAVVLVGAAACWLLLGANAAHADGSSILPDVSESSGTPTAQQPQQPAKHRVSGTVGQAADRVTAVADGASEAVRRATEPVPPVAAPEPVAVAQTAVKTTVATAEKAVETAGTTVAATTDKAVETVHETGAATKVKPVVETVVERVVEPVVKPVLKPAKPVVKPVVKPALDGVREVLSDQRTDLAPVSAALPERSSERGPVRSAQADAGPVRATAEVTGPVAGWSFLDARGDVLSLLAAIEGATALAAVAGDLTVAVIADQAGEAGGVAHLLGGLELSSVSVTGSAGSPTSLALLSDLVVVLGLMLIGLAVARDRRTLPSPASAPGCTPD